MYSIDDVRTPRDRVSDPFLRRLLEEEKNHTDAAPCARSRMDNGKVCEGLSSDSYSLAMVYSPRQIWRGAYDPETALRRGTMFKELDKPLEVLTGKGGDCCGK